MTTDTNLIGGTFGDHIAARIGAEQKTIAASWLARLVSLLPVTSSEVFPGDRLLDHIPELITQIASYVQAPEAEAIAANTAVITKAQQLGELRHAQKASVHQLLQEYRLLGEILTAFVVEETEQLTNRPDAVDCIRVMQRLHECVGVLMQTTVDRFVGEYTQTISQHTRRLEDFNRMVTHELRQPISVLTHASTVLATGRTPDAAERRAFAAIDRSVGQIARLLRSLETLSRVRLTDAADRQRVELSSVAREVARTLEEMAHARSVEIRIAQDLPEITVDVGQLELLLMNLLSNGIKYSDPSKSLRLVEISGGPASVSDCLLLVRDNGLGIPADEIGEIFTRFHRAHADRDGELGVDGLGLGLSIVVECLDAMGGTIRVDSTEGAGTLFTVTLPLRASS